MNFFINSIWLVYLGLRLSRSHAPEPSYWKVFPATPYLWLLKAWVIFLNFCLNSVTSSPNKFATDNSDGAWGLSLLDFIAMPASLQKFPKLSQPQG